MPPAVVIEVWPVALADGAVTATPAPHRAELTDGSALAAAQSLAPTAVWLHSTSWRQDELGIVLTYLAVVPDVAAAEPLDAVLGGSALLPGSAFTRAAVLKHALRHLSFLLERNTELRRLLPGWAEQVATHGQLPAGQLIDP